MRRILSASAVLCLSLLIDQASAHAAGVTPAAPVSQSELTLEKIMSDPDWISRRPENPYWSDDGRTVYYQRKRQGSEIRDLYALDAASGRSREVADAERSTTGAPEAADRAMEWNSRFTSRVFVREGDVFLHDVRAGKTTQLTRTAAAEAQPQFQAGDLAVAYRRGDDWFVRELASGLEAQAADLRLEENPADKKPADDYLARQQERLLDIVRLRRERKEAQDARGLALRAADASRLAAPFYLGKGKAILETSLSPSGRSMVVVLGPDTPDEGKRDKMPDFITASGYVEPRDVRPKVGTPKPESPKVLLLDLASHTERELSYDDLPGLHEDPLKELRDKAEAARKERQKAAEAKKAGDQKPEAAATAEAAETKEAKKEEKAPARTVSVEDVVWNEAGDRVLLQFFSFDNKDRWIAAVDPTVKEPKVSTVDRITDPAWINWDFRELGWMRDGRTAWYLSEESGYSHIQTKGVEPNATERQLTHGDFLIDSPVLSRDGKSFLVRANREHPGVFELYRVAVSGSAIGTLERLTRFDGLSEAVLSPDESKMAILSSSINRTAELFLQDARAGATARKVTDTVTPEFAAIRWAQPEILPIPSTHGAKPIYARVYKPAGWSADRKWPAVAFVHGAGYLQNVHKGWSSYFREFMFHTLLTRKGYVVIDMDYRASAGYGRDWRTAIYRQMGTPELEDYQDGVRWLVANAAVDAKRVGVYGGSYGGFMTFMALFKDPDLFACGAALRPVADWAHYNHEYTSNILNTPEVDPEAYERSSPIEFAQNLRKPLLILHGMVDDNVVFQDSVRLVQKLIELKKTEYFETAIYPVEPHTFREPLSWLDEYARILKLMETNLKD
jgi:dipeptidyl aminopeptidase/acylaminoacyl peptidase